MEAKLVTGVVKSEKGKKVKICTPAAARARISGFEANEKSEKSELKLRRSGVGNEVGVEIDFGMKIECQN